jgi:hypothetical protein
LLIFAAAFSPANFTGKARRCLYKNGTILCLTCKAKKRIIYKLLFPQEIWAHPARAPDRAFRSNSSDLPIANPAGFPLQSLARIKNGIPAIFNL